MYQSKKHLCDTGKALEMAWDNAVQNCKFQNTQVNRDKVYETAKSYFNHRCNCPECKVFWEKK